MPKHRRLIIICLLALIVGPAGIPTVGAIAPDATVWIEPADSVVGLNETFTVRVMIKGAEDMAAFQLDLVYRPSILQVTEATLGDFLGSAGRSVMPVGPTIDNEQGRVSLGAVSFGGATAPSGTGVLAIITCVVQGEGSSILQLQNVQVLNSQADAQSVTVENGRVEVRGAAAPIPTATPSATLRASPAPTATPRPTSTPPAAITSTPTAVASLSPTPTVTKVSLPLSTPSPITPAEETPTRAKPPSPTPSTAATEIRPTETATPPAAPIKTAILVTETPTAALPSPTSTLSTIPMPSPTPAAGLTTPVRKGSWNWIVPVGLLTGLGLIILGIVILRVKREDDK